MSPDQLREYVQLLEDSNAGTLYLKVVELEDSAKELGETVARLFNENCLLREDLAAPQAESEEVVAKLGHLKVSHLPFQSRVPISEPSTSFFLCFRNCVSVTRQIMKPSVARTLNFFRYAVILFTSRSLC